MSAIVTLGVVDPQVFLFHQISSIVSSDLSVDEILGEVIGLAV